MPVTVKSYVSQSPSTPLVPYNLKRRDLRPNDVMIKIIYTGICHSDLHAGHNDWGRSVYPVVPGHEIVGEVENVGADVAKYKTGDIVAVGCMVGSCGECKSCVADQEMFCPKMVKTYGSPEADDAPEKYTCGGYSQKIVVREKFVLSVPKALQEPELLKGVAPILCAGITTYSPIQRYNVKKGSQVAVVGLGGLGHMAVKIAVAKGAEVTVISRSHQKDAQAKELGALHTLSSTCEKEMNEYLNEFDLIIDTIPFDHDVKPYVPLLAPSGTLCIVGHVGMLENSLNTGNLIFGNRQVSGSLIGGIAATQELLDLCGEHKLISDFELIPMENINKAWEDLHKGDNANRYVIDIKNFS